MRINHKYAEVTGAKGINQQEDLADPRTELLDARNLWAPDGHLVQRPGYRGIVTLPPVNWSMFADQDYTSPLGDGPVVYPFDNVSSADDQIFGPGLIGFSGVANSFKSVSGVVTNTNAFNSLAAGDYLGFLFLMNGSYQLDDVLGFIVDLGTSANNTNTAAVYFEWEYYNGTAWKPLNVVEVDANQRKRTNVAFGPTQDTYSAVIYAYSFFCFAPPQDWGTATDLLTPISGTGYWIRAKLRNKGAAAFDATVAIHQPTGGYEAAFFSTQNPSLAYRYGRAHDAELIRFATGQQFISLWSKTGEAVAAADGDDVYPQSCSVVTWAPNLALDSINEGYIEKAAYRMCTAVVPQFDTAYIALNKQVYKLEPTTETPGFNNFADLIADVESDALYVGDGAPYDRDVVAQLTVFPEAQHITFYKGQLWAALENNSVRWSAPIPAHNVWPTLNIEVLPDNNNDPMQALVGFQENMHVFKPDSIWKFVDAGISQFQLQTYAPVKVVSGTGLIAPKGYVVTDNGIFFMSQQGITIFDGVSVKVLSNNIRGYIDRIAPGSLDRVRAVHWRSKQCVLFAVTLDAAEDNNTVLVFDYKNGTWWVWDNLEVVGWLYDDSELNKDRLYFMDSRTRVHEFGVTDEDHGGTITSSFTTQALGDSETTKRFRDIELTGQNLSDSVSVTLMTNDEGEAEGTDATVDFTDTLEAKWDTAVWGTDTWVADRARVRRIGFLESGNSAKVKVVHSEKNTPFEMTKLKLGMVPIGRRR